MKEVTRDWVCLIHALMCNDFEINVGQMIFSAMKKTRYHEGYRYDFGGLLTKFLRRHTVEEEELDCNSVMDAYPIDVTKARSTTGSHGPILTMSEHKAQADDITARMNGLPML